MVHRVHSPPYPRNYLLHRMVKFGRQVRQFVARFLCIRCLRQYPIHHFHRNMWRTIVMDVCCTHLSVNPMPFYRLSPYREKNKIEISTNCELHVLLGILWNNRRTTNCPAFRKTCDDNRQSRQHWDHYVYHRLECISANWQLFCMVPLHRSGIYFWTKNKRRKIFVISSDVTNCWMVVSW